MFERLMHCLAIAAVLAFGVAQQEGPAQQQDQRGEQTQSEQQDQQSPEGAQEQQDQGGQEQQDQGGEEGPPEGGQDTQPARTIDDYTAVTDERLLEPEPANWLHYRRTYNGWGYSPLDQINRQNVSNLVPAWTYSTGVIEGHEAPPIVNDGVMFVSTPENQVIALDAATGDKLWEYERDLPHDLFQLHPTSRGVGLYGDKVYLATLDTYLVALDARTGEVVWEKQVEDHRKGYYMTLAPLVANGKVMVGVSGGELGVRGFVQAFDAETGESVWKTYTIPGEGEEGNDTWPGDTWQHGGAPIWITGIFDPELNLTYWGTGNAAPWIGESRPGDNLYTASVVAMDADTGEIEGHFQYHWNGSWDWDEVASPIAVEFERDGETIKGLVHAARDGYLWFLERSEDGISFVDAREYVFQNVFESIDPETGRPEYDPEHKAGVGEQASFCPSTWGGKDWPPIAYSPQTEYVYIPANENLCSRLVGVEEQYVAGLTYFGARSEFYVREGADHVGELQAWNVNTGEQVWTHEFEGSHTWGPVLATGGGLVFTGGTNDRMFRAFDAETGEVLWQQRTNSGVIGVPVSYEVDGTQYVAVQSGWGVDAVRMQDSIAAQLGGPWDVSVPQGGVVWVFALKEQVGDLGSQRSGGAQAEDEDSGQEEAAAPDEQPEQPKDGEQPQEQPAEGGQQEDEVR
ncbi:MAG TPA: methanol/ethanol family PQQ-dependent dehydrogenase [Trueperaceae bacterium]